MGGKIFRDCLIFCMAFCLTAFAGSKTDTSTVTGGENVNRLWVGTIKGTSASSSLDIDSIHCRTERVEGALIDTSLSNARVKADANGIFQRDTIGKEISDSIAAHPFPDSVEKSHLADTVKHERDTVRAAFIADTVKHERDSIRLSHLADSSKAYDNRYLAIGGKAATAGTADTAVGSRNVTGGIANLDSAYIHGLVVNKLGYLYASNIYSIPSASLYFTPSSGNRIYFRIGTSGEAFTLLSQVAGSINYMEFQNSVGAERGAIGYITTDSIFDIYNNLSTNMRFYVKAGLGMTLDTGKNLTVVKKIIAGDTTTAPNFNFTSQMNKNGVPWVPGLSDSTAKIPNVTWQKSSTAYESAPLGAEILDATGWTTTAGWTGDYNSGFAHSAGTTTLSRSMTTSNGQQHQISWTVTGRTVGSFTVTLGTVLSTESFSATNAFGPTTTANGDLIFTPTTDFDGTISAISVKLITGTYPATQSIINSNGDTILQLRSSRATPSDNGNIPLGLHTLIYNTTGWNNFPFGTDVLTFNTTGHNNAGNGIAVLNANTTGYQNLGSGNGVLQFNIDGCNNTGCGFEALHFGKHAYDNAACGTHALYNEQWLDNSALGTYALGADTNGTGNTACGYYSGASVQRGSYSTFLGYTAGFNALQKTNPYNSMALGNGSYTTADNQIVIGNVNVTSTIINGKITSDSIILADRAKDVIGGLANPDTLYIHGLFANKLGFLGMGNYATPGVLLPNGFTSNTEKEIIEMRSLDFSAGGDCGIFLRNWSGTSGLDLWKHYADNSCYIDSRYDAVNANIYIRTRTAGTPINAITVYGNGGTCLNAFGCNNATPQAQKTVPAAVVGVSGITATQLTPWGFATQGQADSISTIVNNLRTLVDSLRAALVNNGICQ